MMEDLIFIRDKVSSLFAVAGYGGASHGDFQSEIRLNGRVNDGVEAEDFLGAVGVFGVFPHADFGIQIRGQFGTGEEEGIGFGAVAQDDLCKEAPFDDQIQMSPLQLFLNPEDLVKDTGLFRIGLVKTEGKEFHLGPGDFGLSWEPMRGAFHFDADFFKKRLRMVQAVEDSFLDISDDADKLNALAIFLEPEPAPAKAGVHPLYRAFVGKRVPSVAMIV